ncbi:ABC transporter permease [Paenibacillus sp. GCM10027626]|uniref:ABC transporter permease n=1 Tax=Paenibacillus sp. GCM10027626 TaxID=3273411 RepID=UPI0036330F11
MRIQAVAARIIRQFIRDKRTLALLFAAPLLVLTLVKLVFSGTAADPHIGVSSALPKEIAVQLTQAGAAVTAYEQTEQALDALQAKKLDAVVAVTGGQPAVTLEGSDPAASKAVIMVLQKALQRSSSAPQPQISYLHGSPDMSAFDSFGPVLIGFFSFFFVFMLAGVSFLRERTGGTLERLLATPIRRSEVVAGYISGFGLFTLLQAVLIAWYAIDILGIYMDGSLALVLLINLLLSLTALTLGILLSSFAGNEFQIIQFIPLVIVPQVFFSGLFSLDTMAPWLQKLSYIMPLYYGADAMRNIMIRGEGWNGIQGDVYILLGFSALFALLNIVALRRHRAI